MRILYAALFGLTVSTAAFAEEGPPPPVQVNPGVEVHAGDSVAMQRSKGCFYVGGTAAVLSAIGTIGTGTVPAAAGGCFVGAVAAPAAIDAYDKYRLNMAMLVADTRYVVNRGFAHLQQWLDGGDAIDGHKD